MTDFAEFFLAVNGVPPYPWQERLAQRLASGEPPAAIVVPTGGGKTAAIDALVWSLAQQSGLAPAKRTIGVRTVWAIDRRILVDEVFDRVQRLAGRLEAALAEPGDVLHATAAALSSFSGGGPPLMATRWRGQIRSEPRAHHPLQPQVITSTVAQIGSRLLFRGFGVGERSSALEAALGAVDCTICLDEAHLIEPFRQTVAQIQDLRRASEPEGTFAPLRLMTLTATPSDALRGASLHTIDDTDEGMLARRLDAAKLVALIDPGSDNDTDQARALSEAVAVHVAGGARRVACIVNSVHLAALVAQRIPRECEDSDCIVLVGPQRPYDRERILERHGRSIFDRITPERPLVVVATQTIEVGLDADFEAMVSQSASATALVQRLGRLNRAGLDAGRATIVRQRESPLYEHDEATCWAWLEGLRDSEGRIDCSPRALASADVPADARRVDAPALTPATVDLLQQTSPRPAVMADPPVEPFLRGVEEPPADDVGLCWRIDLRLNQDDEQGCDYRRDVLRLAPPRSEEVVTVGLRRLHALLRARFGEAAQRAQQAKVAMREADLEGEAELVTEAQSALTARLIVLRDDEVLEVGGQGAALRHGDVRPGDVVLLDGSAGGYTGGRLDPASSAPVEDVGNAVAWAAAGAPTTEGWRLPVVRLARELVRAGVNAQDALKRARAIEKRGADEVTGESARSLLAPLVDVVEEMPPVVVRRVAGTGPGEADIWEDLLDEPDDFDEIGPVFEEEQATDEAFALVLGTSVRPDFVRRRAVQPPTLADHADSVAERAAAFAAFLDPRERASVVMAARAHDHGKADARVQAFFRGGISVLGEPPIAKSVFGTDDRRAGRFAQRRSGLPANLRHEIASVAVLAHHLERARPGDGWPFDEELALHLVATHHGLGRPWPRVPDGGVAPREFSAAFVGIEGYAHGDGADGWSDGAWLRRFFATTVRYGPWGTAYLEALLILADRTVSAEGR